MLLYDEIGHLNQRHKSHLRLLYNPLRTIILPRWLYYPVGKIILLANTCYIIIRMTRQQGRAHTAE
jgi:hypothetical protein